MSSLRLVLVALACRPALRDPIEPPPDLEPVVAGLEPDELHYSNQPHRDHPYAVALSEDGSKLYVALRGSEAEPGDEIAVVDAATLDVLARIRVGRSPNDLQLHPGGRGLVVTNRFSAHLSIPRRTPSNAGGPSSRARRRAAPSATRRSSSRSARSRIRRRCPSGCACSRPPRSRARTSTR